MSLTGNIFEGEGPHYCFICGAELLHEGHPENCPSCSALVKWVCRPGLFSRRLGVKCLLESSTDLIREFTCRTGAGLGEY